MYKNYKYLMSAGHLCADFNQGVLSSILPFLVATHHYDYATAATLVMVSNIVSSIVQPLFGHFTDKKDMPWSLSLGLLMAGGGMALTGCISSFWGLCIAVMISGIGVALFHPLGALLTNRSASRDHQASAISIFSFGGTVGFTLGPVAATAAISLMGLKGTLLLMIPILVEIICLIISRTGLTELCQMRPCETIQNVQTRFSDDWIGFWKLCIVIFGRSIVFYGYNTFLSLYWVQELGQSEVFGNSVLTVFFALNAVGTLLGGNLADRFGHKQIVLISCFAIMPFAFLTGFAANPIVALIMVLPVGLGLGLCQSPLVTSGQNMLPNHQGLASGVTLGLSVSIGGIFAPLLGSIGNHWGLSVTFYAVGLIAIITLLAALLIPKQPNA